jgi:tetratricopeptide (TPR) repeat protein
MKIDDLDGCMADCTAALQIQPAYFKARLRRATVCEKLDRLEEALVDYKAALELEPACREALEACKRLPKQIEENKEKMKTEMFGNLRKLGDMCLKPFGLSTNNFNMVQDPNTGGYSVNFNQGK